MTDSITIDYFVSYAEHDRGWAEWIGWQLEEAGYTVRLRDWDHDITGANGVLREDRDLAEANRLIVVLSPSYHLSASPQAHWSSFVRRDPAGAARLIIPVEIEESVVGPLLGNLSTVSIVGLSERDAKQRLLSALRDARLKPSRRPGYPGRATPSYPPRQPRTLAIDSKMLLALVTVDAGFFLYGYIAYTDRTGNDGDLIRAVVFLLLIGFTVRMFFRWARRRF